VPTTPIEIVLSGNVAGAAQDGSLSPILFNIRLTAQDARAENTITIEPGDTARVVAVPSAAALGPVGAEQTLFVLKGDRGFTVELNGTPALTFTLKGPNAMLVYSGDLDITSLSFAGFSPLRAKVQLLKVVGTPAPEPTS